MVEMREADPLAREAAKICKLMNVDVKLTSGIWSFRKKRKVAMKNKTSFFRCSLNMNVSFYGVQAGGPAVNIAEVFLLPEEVPVFTSALREKNLLFPTNYLQQMTMEQGMCCLQLESLEPVEHFVKRLFIAYRTLQQNMPYIATTPTVAL